MALKQSKWSTQQRATRDKRSAWQLATSSPSRNGGDVPHHDVACGIPFAHDHGPADRSCPVRSIVFMETSLPTSADHAELRAVLDTDRAVAFERLNSLTTATNTHIGGCFEAPTLVSRLLSRPLESETDALAGPPHLCAQLADEVPSECVAHQREDLGRLDRRGRHGRTEGKHACGFRQPLPSEPPAAGRDLRDVRDSTGTFAPPTAPSHAGPTSEMQAPGAGGWLVAPSRGGTAMADNIFSTVHSLQLLPSACDRSTKHASRHLETLLRRRWCRRPPRAKCAWTRTRPRHCCLRLSMEPAQSRHFFDFLVNPAHMLGPSLAFLAPAASGSLKRQRYRPRWRTEHRLRAAGNSSLWTSFGGGQTSAANAAAAPSAAPDLDLATLHDLLA